MSAKPKRIALLLASGALAVLIVIVVPWCYYGVSPGPIAGLNVSRVHDWSLGAPGGRYGITETGGFIRTTLGGVDSVEKTTYTEIWLGPLGRFVVRVHAPVAALGLIAGMVVVLYGVFKLRDDRQNV